MSRAVKLFSHFCEFGVLEDPRLNKGEPFIEASGDIKLTLRVSSELGIEPEQVWTSGKHPIIVKARNLLCY
jgi:hypothetical protein